MYLYAIGAVAACVRGCCGTQWNTNSTELAVIRDIDVVETNVNCCDSCCRIAGTEKVLISTSLVGEGKVTNVAICNSIEMRASPVDAFTVYVI